MRTIELSLTAEEAAEVKTALLDAIDAYHVRARNATEADKDAHLRAGTCIALVGRLARAQHLAEHTEPARIVGAFADEALA